MAQLAAYGHIVASRRGELGGPVHAALLAAGFTRQVAAVVPAFSTAVALTLHSDWLCAGAAYAVPAPSVIQR
ncbi:hypothetical protein E05_04920 [Plautia stali symbiont]|nr:hypothetical protein E05_04920 [Plautia stali symbiont]